MGNNQETLQMKKEEVRCPHCEYEFPTGSRMMMMTCSNCLKKFNKEENKVKAKGQEMLK